MHQYNDLLQKCLSSKTVRTGRGGHKYRSIFGHQMKFDLADGFPLLTTKFVSFNSILHELLWFISGDTNIRYLTDNKVKIWDEWADENGDLGPVYGAQWRKWKTSSGQFIDQLGDVIHEIKTNPNSRRLVVNAWNPEVLPDPHIPPSENAPEKAVLPPCHTMFQFFCTSEGRLDLQLYQRSADVCLGIPYNIASYSLLLMMVAKICNKTPGVFVHTLGDAHVYENHVENALIQLERKEFDLPQVSITGEQRSIDCFLFQDFQLRNYLYHPVIKFDVAV